MHKRFCDICDTLIPNGRIHTVEVDREIGEPYRSYAGSSLFEKLVTQKIHAKVIFTISNHPTGFGGPPDLCDKCVHDFLVTLEESRREEKP